MGLRTADEYRESLRDGRVLWYRGKRIDDALSEPDLRVAVDHSAVDFEIGHDPAYRDTRGHRRRRHRRGVQRLLPDPPLYR